MPVPCPCCKASNDAPPACRRCKADLSLLWAVEADRDAAIDAARMFAGEGRFAEAAAELGQAAQLRRSPDVLRLRAAALLLARDFPGAAAAYHELGQQGA
ncbi:MAG: hypothetical protein K2X82_30040 [Gemmataceae bacterium]|nr:hypothetical protein [Gemmataceae bacterium]